MDLDGIYNKTREAIGDGEGDIAPRVSRSVLATHMDALALQICADWG